MSFYVSQIDFLCFIYTKHTLFNLVSARMIQELKNLYPASSGEISFSIL
jgi:hypothetical protein